MEYKLHCSVICSRCWKNYAPFRFDHFCSFVFQFSVARRFHVFQFPHRKAVCSSHQCWNKCTPWDISHTVLLYVASAERTTPHFALITFAPLGFSFQSSLAVFTFFIFHTEVVWSSHQRWNNCTPSGIIPIVVDSRCWKNYDLFHFDHFWPLAVFPQKQFVQATSAGIITPYGI